MRIPASYCGIFGYKPTQDKKLLKGVFPLSKTLDHAGYFTRTIDDMIILHRVLNDVEIDSKPNGTLKIGILKEDVLERIDSEVRLTYEHILRRFQMHQLKEVDFVEHAEILQVFSEIFFPEMGHVHDALAADLEEYRKETREMVLRGKETKAIDYLSGLEHRDRIIQQMDVIFESGIDILLTPTVGIKVPMDEEDESFDLDNEMRFTLPFNISGNPALSFNMGYDSNGLPIGLQAIGRRGEDMNLLLQVKQLILDGGI